MCVCMCCSYVMVVSLTRTCVFCFCTESVNGTGGQKYERNASPPQAPSLHVPRRSPVTLPLRVSLILFYVHSLTLSHTKTHRHTYLCACIALSRSLLSLQVVLGDVRLSFSPSLPPSLSDYFSLTL